MKHIKTYEEVNDTFELKKYVVWKWDDYFNEYDILHIVEVDGNIVWCKDLYQYNKDTGIVPVDKNQTSFSKDDYGYQIIYTSDDLNACLEYLKMIIKSEKYNL